MSSKQDKKKIEPYVVVCPACEKLMASPYVELLWKVVYIHQEKGCEFAGSPQARAGVA